MPINPKLQIYPPPPLASPLVTINLFASSVSLFFFFLNELIYITLFRFYLCVCVRVLSHGQLLAGLPVDGVGWGHGSPPVLTSQQ